MSEELIATVNQFNLDGISRTVGDLFFTTERVLFCSTAGKTDVIAYFFGVFGAAITARNSRKASAALQARPLSEIASNAKETFPLVLLEHVTVKKGGLFSSKVILQPRSGKRRKFWGKNKDLEPLLQAVNRLATMGLSIEVR